MGIVFGLIVVVLYFLPVYVAQQRNHRHVSAIRVLTILTGWTGIGWVAALVWAMASER